MFANKNYTITRLTAEEVAAAGISETTEVHRVDTPTAPYWILGVHIRPHFIGYLVSDRLTTDADAVLVDFGVAFPIDAICLFIEGFETARLRLTK